VAEWYTKHPGEVLNKVTFAPLLKEVIECSAKPETLANGFKTCGLYPLNPNALDYSKCLGKSGSASRPIENSRNIEDELKTTMSYSTFIKITGKEKIEKFKRIKDFISGENEDFFTLFHMWEYFQKGREQDEFSDSAVGKIQNENQSVTSDGNDLDFPTVIHDARERMASDHNVNLESGTPRVEDRKSLPAEGSCSNLSDGQYVCSRASSVARVVRTEHMSEFLVWPNTPKRKGKRLVDRQPFAVTSEKYQEMSCQGCRRKGTARTEKETRRSKTR
jgi:hypothetical protein